MGPLVECFGERIIIDFGLGRDTRLGYIVASQEWIWPSIRSSSGLSLLGVPLFLFTQMIGGVIFCTGSMLLELFFMSVMFGMLFIPFRTKWSGGNLYGINMLSDDSL
jgi:hypothetical protein